MRPRTAGVLVSLGLGILAADLAMDALAGLTQDVMQAFDLMLMASGVFCVAEGGFSLWRSRQLRRVDKP